MVLKYTPLSKERKEIRVLRLDPAKDSSSPVSATIEIVSLNESPHYEALSYVWGDVTITKQMTVDNEPIEVHKNLDEALRHLRHKKKPRTVWADAVCINQQDVPEKSVQVPLMGQLYSKATAVLVWLGPSNENVEGFAAWVKSHLADELSASSSTGWLKKRSAAVFSVEKRREMNMSVLRAVEGFWELATRPYWTRMWTFQEFALARKEPVCYCGDVSFLSESLLSGAERPLQEALEKIAKEVGSTKFAGDEDPLVESYLRLVASQVSRIGKLNEEYSNAFSPLQTLASVRYLEKPTMAHLLGLTSNRGCGEPRDKYYALYGMVPDMQRACPVDYGKPFEQIALECTAYIVNEEDPTNLWGVVSLRPGRLDGGFPSWVPDFTRLLEDDPGRHYSRLKLDPKVRQFTVRPRVDADDAATLRIHGRVVGGVQVLLRLADDVPGVLAQMCELLDQADPATPSSPGPAWQSLRSQRGLRDRLVYALLIQSHAPGGADDVTPGELVNRVFFMAGRQPPDPSCWDDSRRKTVGYYLHKHRIRGLVGRRLFVTTGTGLLGIGVDLIADGDLVTTLHANAVPMVLRSVGPGDDGAAGRQGGFRMVGTAYVDGLTEGSLGDEEAITELAGQETREFMVF